MSGQTMKSPCVGIISSEQGTGSGACIALEYLLRGWVCGHDTIMVIAPPDSRIGRLARSSGFRFVALPAAKDRVLHNILAARSIRSQLTDCTKIHAWHSRDFELGWLLGRWLHIPSSGTLHDHPDSSLLSAKRKALLKFVARRINRLICVSGALQDEWKAVCGQTQLQVIHNGLPDIPPSRTPCQTIRIGFLGMYAPMKGFDVIAPWIAASSSENTQWRLYGKPIPQWSVIAQQLAGSHPQRVVLCGEQRPESIFSEIDILVHASVEFETFGMVLAEAARAGIPVVASMLGAASEIVTHGKTGYLFNPVANPDDGLRYLRMLVSDNAARNAMGAAARQTYLDRFVIRLMATQYARFWDLQETIGEQRDPRLESSRTRDA
ncbi:MAG: hypothetical protein C0404_01130 [Verrucomicrobia bacterium]|nr:hypothetical protein [Verrucomicrobiota bacterium]